MVHFTELISQYLNENVAVYGLGTETERFLSLYNKELTIVGLLDGFRTDGEMYDYPIISLQQVLEQSVKLIVVVARPSSTRVIVKRIESFCQENDIALVDVRGSDLLDASAVAFDFLSINGDGRQKLLDMIDDSDVISFDLFDTLVMRETKSYTDVFDLLEYRLRERNLRIQNFSGLRLHCEKELSKNGSPRLEHIYDRLIDAEGISGISAAEMAEMEWAIDSSLLTIREAVKEVFLTAVSSGKKVVITTDSYYSKEQIIWILDKFGLCGYEELYVSCEYGMAKNQGLFGVLADDHLNKTILHIGDDEYTDIEKAKSSGMKAYRIFSAADLFDALGSLGTEKEITSISDRVKIGLFLTRIFNTPFWFEEDERWLSVKDASDIGYLFCAPMITDFTMWLKESVRDQGYAQVLFGARDGYLVDKLFGMTDSSEKSLYFHTSRTAAIRAGMESQEDIDYVDSMKFFGTPKEALSVRFGIEELESIDRTTLILEKARQQRENYRKYIDKLRMGQGKLALFDFVAKGTTQMYLQKLFPQHMKGFYFLHLEPEVMAEKGLDIESFYSDQEKNSSAILNNYSILETVLTAPYPQVLEMDAQGNPVYAEETRTERDLQCFARAQQGILRYFEEYMRILPEEARQCNKRLDDKLLALLNKVLILDADFLSLKVEDQFFGRMTDMRDAL